MKTKKAAKLPPAAARLAQLVKETKELGYEIEQLWRRSYPSLPAPTREHIFDHIRSWRFDLCWPTVMVAVEGEGGVVEGKGGHSSVSGILRDVEKYNAAALLGWTVIRVHRKSIDDGTYLPLFDWVAGRLKAGPADAEIEAALAAVKGENAPEDKIIAKYGYSWDDLEKMARQVPYPGGKMAAALLEMGDVCEEAVERAAFYKLLADKKGHKG